MNKKTYTKPDIFFEDFSLSTNIAAGCELFPVNSTDACPARWGNLFIFQDSLHGCSTPIEDGKNAFNNACYHVPNENKNVFFS